MKISLNNNKKKDTYCLKFLSKKNIFPNGKSFVKNICKYKDKCENCPYRDQCEISQILITYGQDLTVFPPIRSILPKRLSDHIAINHQIAKNEEARRINQRK